MPGQLVRICPGIVVNGNGFPLCGRTLEESTSWTEQENPVRKNSPPQDGFHIAAL